jgi:2-iminobutanoate/2-iminopropanoate deaminase
MKIISGLLLLLTLPALALAQTPTTAPTRTHLMSKLAVQRNLPFSSGVIAGDTLYVAGTIGLDPSTPNKNISAADEARSAMNQVKQVVEQAGMAMDDVVSVQVFCTDLANYDAFNRVYRTYFHGKYPARAFVGVDHLLFGARYEIMATAVSSQMKRK